MSSDGIERRFAGAGGDPLVATQRGEGGRPVLLLHGGGQTRHAFAHAARGLAEAGFTSVALDQRGHGDSARIPSGAYAFEDFAADAIAVSRALAEEHGTVPAVIGASLGGIAALLALHHAPTVFGALVLVDVTPRMDPSGVDKVQGFMRSRAAEGFASVEEAADAIAAYLPHRPRPRSLEGLAKNLRREADGRWRWHWDPRFIEGPRSVNFDRAGVEERLLAASAALSVPALLVRGASSELVSEEHAAEFMALAPDAETTDVAGARHMVAGDRNDAFSAATLDFLKRRFR